MTPTILGLDIGGANLKAATNTGLAETVPFALWKQPEKLPEALEELVARFPNVDELSVTMTGELCDCFLTKREGVNHIVTSVMNVSLCRPIRVWSTDGAFVTTNDAKEFPLKVAAANWHALATFVGGYVPRGVTLLLDMGSTTTDIIPIMDGVPWTDHRTDMARLKMGELVYTGVRRTPATTFLGTTAAAEFFATVLDAYLMLNMVRENAEDCDTADGRPATQPYAHARLSRMVGGDREATSQDETMNLARFIVNQQQKLLETKIETVLPRIREMRWSSLNPQRTAILSGTGEFFLRKVLSNTKFEREFDEMFTLGERLGPTLSAAAPAYAVARLAAERPL